MQPVATTFFFYFLSAVTVTSGVMVITRRNPVHSALALILALLGQAGLYLMLYAPFVAGVQIILYAGGIMVLFLFVIMLVNIERSQKEEQFNKQWIVGIAAALALGVLFVVVYTKGRAFSQLHLRNCRKPTTRRASRCFCIAITCFPSRSHRCCCWLPSSGRW